MKNVKKMIVAGAILASTVLSADALSLKAGYGSLSDDGTSYSGGTIGLEGSLGNMKNFDLYLDINYGGFEDLSLVEIGLGLRYNVYDNLWLGVTGEAASLSTSLVEDVSSFVGVMYGANAKYAFTPNHALIAEYKTGTLSDSESGLIDIDVSTMAFMYSYTF